MRVVGKFNIFHNCGKMGKGYLAPLRYCVFLLDKALQSAIVVVQKTHQHVVNERFYLPLTSRD